MDIVDQLVNHQVAKWAAQQEAAAKRGEPPAPEAQRPIITLSREDGADDEGDVERAVASGLGFDVFGRELIEQIAQLGHVRKQVVESLDERVQGRISNWLGEQFGRGAFSQSEYLQDLCQILATLGHHGHAIVIGRGAQYILDPSATLRVRLYAPFEWRVERVAKRLGVSIAEARSRVRHADADREAFCRRHFGHHVGDLAFFDLVLNRSTLSAATCARLVEDAFRARFVV